jgi:ferric-dicitrate binding protein FerR (iron transport regulator)
MAKTEKNRIEHLTFAFLERGLNIQERNELKFFLQDPDMRDYFKQQYLIWNVKQYEGCNAEKAYEKILSIINKERINPEQSKNKNLKVKWIVRVAASLLIFFLGMGSYYLIDTHDELCSDLGKNSLLLPKKTEAITCVKVPLGSKSQVNMPDGTVIILNAGSQLEYSADYGNEERRVKLEGEGYFQVAKDENSTFIVSAKNTEIKALGTAFNVKAYSDEDYVQTTLVEGSVSIKPDKECKDNNEILLKSNEMVIIRRQNQLTTIEKNHIDDIASFAAETKTNNVQAKNSPQVVNPVLYTSWKDKRWVIEGEEMESLILKLERRYNVKFIIASAGLEKYKFSGIFQEETLEQVLEIMKNIVPINYSLDKKTVKLTINPNRRKIFEKSMTHK